ncbi:MAG TPA: MBL fold metallo-hydrolase [Allosphingosinicella sp.]|nr:MBL fold metallo-hydrolase [Allosphingosinicella sp.]
MKLRMLGCGTSSGVPRIGNDWGRCDPAEPRNRRSRVSILVEQDGARILVDTSPDLREQLLAAGVADIAAVIWTHDHADHCHGIDDLRQLFHARGAPVAGYARPETLDALRRRFGYAFEGKGDYPPVVEARVLTDRLRLGGVGIDVVDQPHGSITAAGLRFEHGGKTIGYSTDFNQLTDDMIALYQGIDVWIIDALRHRPHPSHPHLAQALEWIGIVRPVRAILTHMDNSMDYRALLGELPDGVEPGYDGLEVEL